ncbi:MAG: hypothetical protein M1828_000457 [Chrysothrix sp. TS-e1954]|nr:MAG: hypothetical protein M1828_000457 [Chrysothrix sp. TS-e1954]
MDRENLWNRRSNLNRQSSDLKETQSGNRNRVSSTSKRFSSGEGGSYARANGIAPLNTTSTNTAPGASSAFGLGSGAFASFGAASKAPKTASAVDFGSKYNAVSSPVPESERNRTSSNRATQRSRAASSQAFSKESPTEKSLYPLKHSWVLWYRPPTSKNSDYEKSIKPVFRLSSVQEYWRVYTLLKHPSALPIVSDYHFFKDGIRPVWEDDENKKGGKWIMRLKKGVIDRYWDEMLLATIGDQFAEAGEEVCGMVVSVRNGEDVLSVWTKNDGGRNIKIRETIKRVLNLPTDTAINWRSHDDSIAQRSAIDQARQEKGGPDKRRNTLNDSNAPGR